MEEMEEKQQRQQAQKEYTHIYTYILTILKQLQLKQDG